MNKRKTQKFIFCLALITFGLVFSVFIVDRKHRYREYINIIENYDFNILATKPIYIDKLNVIYSNGKEINLGYVSIAIDPNKIVKIDLSAEDGIIVDTNLYGLYLGPPKTYDIFQEKRRIELGESSLPKNEFEKDKSKKEYDLRHSYEWHRRSCSVIPLGFWQSIFIDDDDFQEYLELARFKLMYYFSGSIIIYENETLFCIMTMNDIKHGDEICGTIWNKDLSVDHSFLFYSKENEITKKYQEEAKSLIFSLKYVYNKKPSYTNRMVPIKEALNKLVWFKKRK